MSDTSVTEWAIGGEDAEWFADEYAIEPGLGFDALLHSGEIIDVIEALPLFKNGRVIRRRVTYGPWEYVSAEAVQS